MTLWQVDLHRPPLRDAEGEPLWELLVCDASREFRYEAQTAQGAVNVDWVAAQLQAAVAQSRDTPAKIQVFRPQALPLLTLAAERLEVAIIRQPYISGYARRPKPTPHCPTLLAWFTTHCILTRRRPYRCRKTCGGIAGALSP
jgi:hypothetical protein